MSKQIYAICCYTCEHNGQETCKGCNTILNGENEPYENWQLREDLCRKDKQIADLQHKLEVSEIATKLACERVKYFEEMQDREMGFEDLFGYESHYDLQGIIEKYKEQAEKEIKGE